MRFGFVLVGRIFLLYQVIGCLEIEEQVSLVRSLTIEKKKNVRNGVDSERNEEKCDCLKIYLISLT